MNSIQPTPRTTRSRVATYIDFPNFALGIAESAQVDVNSLVGQALIAEALVDVCRIAASYGPVGTTVVFGSASRLRPHWAAIRRIRAAVFEVIGAGKNGTDIEMALEVACDLSGREFSHVLLVTGDNDFAPLARRVRTSGRYVIGVNTPNSGGQLLRGICHATHTLKPVMHGGRILRRARQILAMAIHHGCRSMGYLSLPVSELPKAMGAAGRDARVILASFQNLSALLRACSDVVVFESDRGANDSLHLSPIGRNLLGLEQKDFVSD